MYDQREDNLDVVRTLACLMVVFVHLSQKIIIIPFLSKVFSYGGYGVDIFFFLSGYLSYDSLEKERYQKRVCDYYFGRIARIVPLYYLFVAFYFALSQVGYLEMPVDETRLGWLRYLLFINLWVKSSEPWMNLQGLWCVSVFLLFYIIVPFYHKIFKNFMMSVYGFVILYLFNIGLRHTIFNRSPLMYLYIFGFGILVNRAIKEFKVGMLMTVIYVVSVAFLFMGDKEGWLVLMLTSFFIIGTVYLKSSDNGRGNDIYKKVIKMIADYSYTIYFVHLAILLVLENWRGDKYVFLSLFFICTICVSYVLQKTFVQWTTNNLLHLSNKITRNM